MTSSQSAGPLLTDVERTQKRTRRRLDDNWFTFAAIGAALLAGGVTQASLGDAWSYVVFAVALVAAYLAVALRTRRTRRDFVLEKGRIPLAPLALSTVMAIGGTVLGLSLEGSAAVAAVAGWTAVGFVVFAVWHRDPVCLALAAGAAVVGVTSLALDGGAALSNTLYGVTFVVAAAGAWFLAGRRTQ